MYIYIYGFTIDVSIIYEIRLNGGSSRSPPPDRERERDAIIFYRCVAFSKFRGETPWINEEKEENVNRGNRLPFEAEGEKVRRRRLVQTVGQTDITRISFFLETLTRSIFSLARHSNTHLESFSISRRYSRRKKEKKEKCLERRIIPIQFVNRSIPIFSLQQR